MTTNDTAFDPTNPHFLREIADQLEHYNKTRLLMIARAASALGVPTTGFASATDALNAVVNDRNRLLAESLAARQDDRSKSSPIAEEQLLRLREEIDYELKQGFNTTTSGSTLSAFHTLLEKLVERADRQKQAAETQRTRGDNWKMRAQEAEGKLEKIQKAIRGLGIS